LGFLDIQREDEAPGPGAAGSSLLTRTYPTGRLAAAPGAFVAAFGILTFPDKPRGESPPLSSRLFS